MHARESNLLGALAQAITDRVNKAAEAGARHGAMAPAALTQIGFYPGESIDALRRTLRLSHSGTVRLVDRLVADSLVERRPGTERRSVALFLTPAGKRAHAEVLERRRREIATLLGRLPKRRLSQLTLIAEELLRALTDSPAEADFICRLCEIDACPQDRCPVHREAEQQAQVSR